MYTECTLHTLHSTLTVDCAQYTEHNTQSTAQSTVHSAGIGSNPPDWPQISHRWRNQEISAQEIMTSRSQLGKSRKSRKWSKSPKSKSRKAANQEKMLLHRKVRVLKEYCPFHTCTTLVTISVLYKLTYHPVYFWSVQCTLYCTCVHIKLHWTSIQCILYCTIWQCTQYCKNVCFTVQFTSL